MSKTKSKISISDFTEIPLRETAKNSEQVQINIFIEKDKKTALKLFAIKNNASVSGLVTKLIDLFIEAEQKEK